MDSRFFEMISLDGLDGLPTKCAELDETKPLFVTLQVRATRVAAGTQRGTGGTW